MRKQERLQRRAAEAEGLQSETDAPVSQVSPLRSAAEEAETVATGKAEKARESQRRLQSEAAVLHAQLKEKEEALRRKDSVIRELEENVAGKVRELQAKEELLQSREAELKEAVRVVEAIEDEKLKLREGMSAEIQKLTSELTEKKIALASHEREQWRTLGRRNSRERMRRKMHLDLSLRSVMQPLQAILLRGFPLRAAKK